MLSTALLNVYVNVPATVPVVAAGESKDPLANTPESVNVAVPGFTDAVTTVLCPLTASVNVPDPPPVGKLDASYVTAILKVPFYHLCVRDPR